MRAAIPRPPEQDRVWQPGVRLFLRVPAAVVAKPPLRLGLLSLLQQRGLRVQPCKVGPDYLDTAWHTAISGVASRNLDSFMLPAPILNALFAEQLQQADIAVIEGVMGLYDGYGIDPNYYAAARRWLNSLAAR